MWFYLISTYVLDDVRGVCCTLAELFVLVMFSSMGFARFTLAVRIEYRLVLFYAGGCHLLVLQEFCRMHVCGLVRILLPAASFVM